MAVLFFEKAVPASSSGAADLAGHVGETVFFEPEGFAPTRFEVFSTDDYTAGTLTVTLNKNGVAVVGAVAVLNDTVQRSALQLSGVAWAPGDRMTVTWVSASLAPTTSDLIAIVS
jgi:hypothetical protein